MICQRAFNLFAFVLGLMTAALVLSSNGEAREQLDVSYYNAQGKWSDCLPCAWLSLARCRHRVFSIQWHRIYSSAAQQLRRSHEHV